MAYKKRRSKKNAESTETSVEPVVEKTTVDVPTVGEVVDSVEASNSNETAFSGYVEVNNEIPVENGECPVSPEFRESKSAPKILPQFIPTKSSQSKVMSRGKAKLKAKLEKKQQSKAAPMNEGWKRFFAPFK